MNIDFQNPELLFLLIILIPLPLIMWKGYQIRQHSLRIFTGKSWNLSGKYLAVTMVVIIFLSTLLLQAAGPRQILTSTDKNLSANIVFLIDVSRSMAARIDCDARTRLDRAKTIISRVVTNLPSAKFSFASFSGLSFILSEMTYDRQYIMDIIHNGIFIEVVPFPGSDISNALHVIIEKKMEQPRVYEHVDYLILISDGDLAAEDIKALETTAPLVRDAEIEIISVGMGTDEGIPIPTLDKNQLCIKGQYERAEGKEFYTHLVETPLRKVSDATGGIYFHESEEDELRVYLMSKLEPLATNKPPLQTVDLNWIFLSLTSLSLFLFVLLKRL